MHALESNAVRKYGQNDQTKWMLWTWDAVGSGADYMGMNGCVGGGAQLDMDRNV